DSDFAVLLRDVRGTAVSAATLDVYGSEVVVMDLMATAEEARGRGHGRVLVNSLEQWLTEAGTRHWVVCLSSTSASSAASSSLASLEALAASSSSSAGGGKG
ncbi:hypothetical protein Agub_g4916, partial [Astrephomene gubernaculifera]